MFAKAIVTTLLYHDIFDYPLKKEEIYRFLCLKTDSEIQSYLDALEKRKKIFQRKGFYFLPKRDKIILFRKKRGVYSSQKMKIAKTVAGYLGLIPWIKMIAVTGGLAMNNAKKDDDIDFLIATETNRLWLTRILAILILEILRKRRRPKQKEIKDKICLNLFLDDKALNFSEKERNLFIAHEICQLRPILDYQQTYEKFLALNQWTTDFLPNTTIKPPVSKTIKNKLPRVNSPWYSNRFKNKKKPKPWKIFDFIERVTYQLQLGYMSSKRTGEKVSPHFAFFHPNNQRNLILGEYKKRIAKL